VETKRFSISLAVLLLASGCHPAAKDSGTTFYLQLVRAGDGDVPPTSDSKPIGPKLRHKLQCAFKWKHYWEIKRDTVTVPQGGKVREHLNPEQAVEIELLDSDKVAVRVYSGGQLIRSRQQPADNAFCVTGGHSGGNQCWFIIVRRDEPQTLDSY